MPRRTSSFLEYVSCWYSEDIEDFLAKSEPQLLKDYPSVCTLPRQWAVLKPRSSKASWSCLSSSTTGCFSTRAFPARVKTLLFDLVIGCASCKDLTFPRLAFVVPFPWTSKVTQCERCNSSGADYQLTYEPWQHGGGFALIESCLKWAQHCFACRCKPRSKPSGHSSVASCIPTWSKQVLRVGALWRTRSSLQLVWVGC